MKRLLAIILAVVMLASVLVGCAGSADPTTTQTPAKTDTADSGNEVVTLNVLARGTYDDTYGAWQDELNAALLEAGLNVQLNWEWVASSGYADYCATLFSTGENLPDIVYFQGCNDRYFAQQGLLVDLSDYVASSTYVKECYDADAVAGAQLENFPYVMWLGYQYLKCIYLRQDALEACDIYDTFVADPSIDNYYTLFSQIKAQGYDSVFSLYNLASLYYTFDEAFGLTSTWIKGDDGSYTYNRVSDESLAELEFFAKLYADGIMDSNIATNTWETTEEAAFSGSAAGLCGSISTADYYSNSVVASQGEGTALEVMVPAAGVEQGFLIDPSISAGSESHRGWAITTACQNVDAAFSVFEFLMSPEGRPIDLFGIEGTTYTDNGDGTYTLLDAFDNWYEMFFKNTTTLDVSTAVVGDKSYIGQTGQQALDNYYEYSKADNRFLIPDDYSGYWDACSSLWGEFAMQFILGQKTAADWEAFVADWNANGGTQVTEYANSILN